MKRIDISGPLSNKMWEYGHPFPYISIQEKRGYTEGFGYYTFTEINGLHSLSGTYLETPAHYRGYDNCYLIDTVPLDMLVDIDCVVLNVKIDKIMRGEKSCITLDDLLKCENADKIKEGDAIIVGTGWGTKMWFEKEKCFADSPYFTKEAFMWLLDKKPCLIGTDTPCWDNLKDPCGLFDEFYKQDILMLACLKNVEQVTKDRTKLTVLPVLVENTCAAACRAFITEE